MDDHVVGHDGHVVKTTGDGVLATFDGPSRAVACARAMMTSLRSYDMRIRAGVHTGEIERVGDDVAGLAVHIGARIAAIAEPSEIYVSRTVKDLVVGSGIELFR